MRYGFIVERLSDFEIGKYYVIVSNDEIIDAFLCTNLDTAAQHYLTYTARSCEIWRYFAEKEERDEMLNDLLFKRDEFYQLFANGRRSCKRNLGLCCELARAMNRFKKVFKSKKG